MVSTFRLVLSQTGPMNISMTKSPNLSPIDHLWDVLGYEVHSMNVQLTNLHQLCDARISTRTRISTPAGIHVTKKDELVLKAKGVLTSISMAFLIKSILHVVTLKLTFWPFDLPEN